MKYLFLIISLQVSVQLSAGYKIERIETPKE